jgi:hypothetical protein
MTLTIQWIECDGGTLESAEGRFAIRPDEDGSYTLLERFVRWPEGGDPVAALNSCSFPTEEQCQQYAHKRLESYWHS